MENIIRKTENRSRADHIIFASVQNGNNNTIWYMSVGISWSSNQSSVCVREKDRFWCDVYSGCVTTRKSVVRLVTPGWKRCVRVCNVDTRPAWPLDLGLLATWEVDLGPEKVEHPWSIKLVVIGLPRKDTSFIWKGKKVWSLNAWPHPTPIPCSARWFLRNCFMNMRRMRRSSSVLVQRWTVVCKARCRNRFAHVHKLYRYIGMCTVYIAAPLPTIQERYRPRVLVSALARINELEI